MLAQYLPALRMDTKMQKCKTNGITHLHFALGANNVFEVTLRFVLVVLAHSTTVYSFTKHGCYLTNEQI